MPLQCSLSDTVFRSFGVVSDPRAKNVIHPMETILFVLIVGVLCGGDGIVQIERIAHLKENFLRRYVDLSAGIPSHDTLSRFLQVLEPTVFARAFTTFIAQVTSRPEQQIVSIDGKTLRGVAKKHSQEQAHAEDQVHMVQAFSQSRNVVLAQLRSAAVANEVHAARELLSMLELDDTVVTADCAHSYAETFDLIAQQGGDAVVGLKKNQPTVHEELEEKFALARSASTVLSTVEKGHGRIEERRHEVRDVADFAQVKARFPTVKSVVCVQRTRQVLHGKTSQQVSYYVSTLTVDQAERTVECIRAHWGIENRLHWPLDVSFSEDACRVRIAHAAENLSRIRHLVLSLLHQDKQEKGGLKTKRLVALASDSFVASILHLPYAHAA